MTVTPAITFANCILGQFLKPHVEKSRSIFPINKSPSLYSCDICLSPLPDSHLEIALCPYTSCPSKYHLTCLASRLEKSDSILPVNGPCRICGKEILWGDVVRGVFGRAGHIAQVNSDEEESGSDGSSEEANIASPTRRKRKVCGLVKLTGKPRSAPEASPKGKSQDKAKNTTSSKAKRKVAMKTSSRENQDVSTRHADQTDIEVHQIEELDQTPPQITKPEKSRRQPKKSNLVIPDSAGEESDVWVISSEDDRL
jgi:hypothetical protein